MFFRRTTGDDPLLPLKAALFTVGAVLALAGMLLENDWVIAAAAVVLLAGMALRFFPRRREDAEPPETGERP